MSNSSYSYSDHFSVNLTLSRFFRGIRSFEASEVCGSVASRAEASRELSKCLESLADSLEVSLASSVLAVLAVVAAAAPGSFRGHSGHTVAVKDVKESLQTTMQAILQGQGSMIKQLDDIEQSIWQTYQSLPKNEAGHIGARAVRYLVHNYFAKEHGWLIKGLEPHGNQENMSEVHEVSILQDKAPLLVESLLEARRTDRGLSLTETIAMIATLERLIVDEASALLQAAYALNSVDTEERLSERGLHEVLTSYLVLFEMGGRAVLDNREIHRVLKAKAALAGGNWPLLVEFAQDATYNFGFAQKHSRNPFQTETLYSFQDAEVIVEDLTRGYGKWQNTECQQMKRELMDLDPLGLGRVPLSRFYSQPENAEYHFTETQEYLREVGALEDSKQGAYVRIANYMTGPSNCIASSSYYSVCCLNECEVLMNELESHILAPSASPQRLLGLARNLSSGTVDAPRQLPAVMEEKLHAIAARHDGNVPLHGRLFAQWMHHAFPHECPYPHIAENTSILTPTYWMDQKIVTSRTERDEVEEVTEEILELDWSHEEVLAAHHQGPKSRSFFSDSSLAIRLVQAGLRFVMQLGLIVGLLRMVLGRLAAAPAELVPEKIRDFLWLRQWAVSLASSVLAVLAVVAAAAPGSFRGHSGHTVAVKDVKESLQTTMQAILQGQGSMIKQLDDIEQSIWQTYQSLPKNEAGHIGARAVRYLVHNYFAKEHGWLIKGLEPHGHQENLSEVHEVSILQDKAPLLVESLLEARRTDRGLSLTDAVAMIATLERLIVDEASSLLHVAYDLNSFSSDELLQESEMHEVLTSYLVLFEMGHKANLTSKDVHRALKARASYVSHNWPFLVEFEHDALHNYLFATKDKRNPFVQEAFAFDSALQIVETLASGYGKWQNAECQQMKRELMDMDDEGKGIIPLHKFYSQPESADYHFTESQEYLDKVGALQLTEKGNAYVRIANYMTGPSNCIASSSYYSVCCLNECEVLMNELESHILAPSASPQRLLGLARNLSSGTVDAPRQLPAVMEEKLHAIAARHDGNVPLHGRLFAQWMHHAFPHECPYPHIAENNAVLAPDHWQNNKATVSTIQRAELAEVHTPVLIVENVQNLSWSEEELVVVKELPKLGNSNLDPTSESLRMLLSAHCLN
eukprot:Skav208922  [mRNA]  locus=scaffold787:114145:120874:+ [translate_table: standard]